MKNKFLFCFRPVGVEPETEPDVAGCFHHRGFTSIKVAGHADAIISTAGMSVSTCESPNCSENKNQTRKRAKSKSFSGVVKAVLFEISLKKKGRNTKALHLAVGSILSYSSQSEAFSDILKPPKANCQCVKSESLLASSSSLSSSSSCSSSLSSPTGKGLSKTENMGKQSISSPPEQQSKLQSENRVACCSNSSSAVLLVPISLAVTIFYGRLSAVLFSSLCLYFLYRRSSTDSDRQLPPGNRARPLPEIDSSAREDMKRVIMEGLLERRYRRRL